MPAMTMVQALNSAMDVMLGRDPDVVIFGEDVGFYGGVSPSPISRQTPHGKRQHWSMPPEVRRYLCRAR